MSYQSGYCSLADIDHPNLLAGLLIVIQSPCSSLQYLPNEVLVKENGLPYWQSRPLTGQSGQVGPKDYLLIQCEKWSAL
jgi:hypothetical protein